MFPTPVPSKHLLASTGILVYDQYFSKTHTSHHCNKNDVEIWANEVGTKTSNPISLSLYTELAHEMLVHL
jgi:hypothetical protein